MSEKIYQNRLLLTLRDKEIDCLYDKMKEENILFYSKFFLILLFIQSIFVCGYISSILGQFNTNLLVSFTSITSYISACILTAFLVFEVKKINLKYYLIMHNITYYLILIVNLNFRIVLGNIIKINAQIVMFFLVFEILFRLCWMLVASKNNCQCYLLNIATIISICVLLPLLTPVSIFSEVIPNTVGYSLGLIFVQLFQYFYERKNKEAFYHNSLSKRNTDWMTRIFENINTGFISIKSGKISFINSFLKNLLKEIQKEKNRNYETYIENIANDSSLVEIKNDFYGCMEDPDQIVSILVQNLDFTSKCDLNLKNTISFIGNESKFDYVTKFIEMIKDIPNINNFKLIGDKAFKMGQAELYFEVQCRYQTNGDDYELELVFNDVTRTRTIERTNAEFTYKTLFLSKVAHEFRNPLISIAELINQSLDILQNLNEKNESLENNIAQIQSLSNYLLVLTKDLNYFNETQISQKGIIVEPKETNLIEVIDFCTNITEALLLNSNKANVLKFKVNLEDNESDKIITDESRLKQILVNLLSNAVKFTQTGEIILEVSSENIGNDTKIKFSVKDTGIGISEQNQMELFNTLENSSNKCQNAGLGILINKEIASKLGSKIEFTSSLGIGSHFWFTIGFKMLNQEDNNVVTIMVDQLQDHTSITSSQEKTIEVVGSHECEKFYRKYLEFTEETALSTNLLSSPHINSHININNDFSISNSSVKVSCLPSSNHPERHPDFSEVKSLRKKSSILNMKSISESRISSPRKKLFANEDNVYNIIVTDDDYLPRQSTVRILNKISEQLNINFNIIEAEDGIDTINHVYHAWKSGAKISLILSDQNMNFMYGTNSAEIIKEVIHKNKLDDIPFYVVSSYGMETFNIAVLSYVNKILSKPISLKETKEIIIQHMHN